MDLGSGNTNNISRKFNTVNRYSELFHEPNRRTGGPYLLVFTCRQCLCMFWFGIQKWFGSMIRRGGENRPERLDVLAI